MLIELNIPSPGESITEVQLARWFVEDGGFVEKDQEIGEIESDKATLPLIAPESGHVSFKIMAGDMSRVGSLACTIDPSKKAPGGKKASPAKTSDKPVGETIENKYLQAPPDNTAQTANTVEEKQSVAVDKKYPGIKITPVAAKIMQANNLSADDVISGLKRITANEVNLVLQNKHPHRQTKTLENNKREEARKPVSQLRKKLAERLVAVKNETAMLTTFNEINMQQVVALRKKYQSTFVEKYGIKLGFMSLFARAVAESLKQFPLLNARLDNSEIVIPSYIDIGVAVQTDKGLMVPVLRNAGSLSIAETELQINELAQKALAGRLSIEEMTGGTFTITNGGVFGSLFSTPILNPPQTGILGMHNIIDRPVAVDGRVEIHPMMYVALSYDHRVVDGKDSVSFLVSVKKYIESPANMLFGDKSPEETLLDI